MTVQHNSESGADSARNGLRDAFMDLRPALLRFMIARGASPEDAADLVQDLFLKLDSGVAAASCSNPAPISKPCIRRTIWCSINVAQRNGGHGATRYGPGLGDDPERDERPSPPNKR